MPWTADVVLYAVHICGSPPATSLPFVNYILTSFLYFTNILQPDVTANIAHTKKKKKEKKNVFVYGLIGKSQTEGNSLPCPGNQFLLLLLFCFFKPSTSPLLQFQLLSLQINQVYDLFVFPHPLSPSYLTPVEHNR